MNKVRISFLLLMLPLIMLYNSILSGGIKENSAQGSFITKTIECTLEQKQGIESDLAAGTITVQNSPYKCLGKFKLTAYYGFPIPGGRPIDENGNIIAYTSTGTKAKAKRTIAVDPKIIPYGSTVIIEINGVQHEYIAEDCGGAIKNNIIDIYYDTKEECINFGVQHGNVYILNT